MAEDHSTKGEKRERQRSALAAKGQKHNYARWQQVQNAQTKRAATPSKSPKNLPPP